MTTQIADPLLPRARVFGRKNLLSNPQFEHWDLGLSTGYVTQGSYTYMHCNRVRAVSAQGTMNIARVASTRASGADADSYNLTRYAYEVRGNSASATGADTFIAFRLPADLCEKLYYEDQVTLSFYILPYPTASTITPQLKVYTPTSANRDHNGSTTLRTTVNRTDDAFTASSQVWTRWEFTFNPALANLQYGAELRITGLNLSSSSYYNYIKDAQLEIGPQATKFEPLPIYVSRAECNDFCMAIPRGTPGIAYSSSRVLFPFNMTAMGARTTPLVVAPTSITVRANNTTYAASSTFAVFANGIGRDGNTYGQGMLYKDTFTGLTPGWAVMLDTDGVFVTAENQ